jgi:phosphoglycolate phosphatase
VGNYFVDLDGTIIDPKSGMVGAFRRALREMGYDNLAAGDLDWVIGPPVITSLVTLLRKPKEAEEALRIYRKHYTPEALLLKFSVYPYILSAIAELQDMGRVFICTMKPTVLAESILAELGLTVGLFGADLDGKITSKDTILDRAVRELAVNPAACLVIGDRGSDMTAAGKTGMLALGVTWGYGTSAELCNAGAQALCHSPESLSQIARDLLFR